MGGPQNLAEAGNLSAYRTTNKSAEGKGQNFFPVAVFQFENISSLVEISAKFQNVGIVGHPIEVS